METAIIEQQIRRFARPGMLHKRSLSTNYFGDPHSMARWLDVSVVKLKGKVFATNESLIPKDKALVFPNIPCTTLNGASAIFPGDIKGLKFLSLSFKQYGFTLVRSWSDPFSNFLTSSDIKRKIVPVEVCFVEYGFLSIAKSVFINNLRSKVAEDRFDNSGFAFGGIKPFADKADLPNIFTGYNFLLDDDNNIRWRGCGQATEADLKALNHCAQQLAAEHINIPTSSKPGSS